MGEKCRHIYGHVFLMAQSESDLIFECGQCHYRNLFDTEPFALVSSEMSSLAKSEERQIRRPHSEALACYHQDLMMTLKDDSHRFMNF